MFFDIQFSMKYQKMAEVIFGNFFLFAIMFNFRDFPQQLLPVVGGEGQHGGDVEHDLVALVGGVN